MDRELLLLGLLRQQKMHGYKLMAFIETNMQICTDLKKSTAYLLLENMEKNGWVTKIEEPNGSRPPKRTYEITDQGEKTFQKFLRTGLQNFQSIFFENDVSYLFWDVLSIDDRIFLLEEKKKKIDLELKKLESIPHHADNTQLLIDHQKYYLKSEQQWVNHLIVKSRTQFDQLSTISGEKNVIS